MSMYLNKIYQFGKSLLTTTIKERLFLRSEVNNLRKNMSLTSQSFAEIIENDQIYVDKTRQIHQLINLGKYFFLSRPRRFGKSLLISTLKELFSGNKHLFKGLWIYDKYLWESYPVIHIDMSKVACDEEGILKISLSKILDKIARSYDIQLDKDDHYQHKFSDLIEKMAERNLSGPKKVVVLIDEYDKPVVDYIHMTDMAEAHRKILHDFYSILKSDEEHLKFVFLTGVSRFSRMSIFSPLNNMIDISVKSLCNDIAGYTEDEIESYFSWHLNNLVKELNSDMSSVMKTIRYWYKGYSWDGKTILYNPQSIMLLFIHKCFDDYWSESGTPSFLIQLIQKKNISPEVFENTQLALSDLAGFEPMNIRIPVLLWQTGYLTIKHFEKNPDGSTQSITLDYPNHEVKLSFINYLIQGLSLSTNGEVNSIINKMIKSINNNNMDSFFQLMKNVFALIPYQIFNSHYEKYYHTVIYIILTLIGFHKDVDAEIQTNIGRIDAVLKSDKNIYIIEFKMDSAQKALDQIKEMGYADKYQSWDRPIWLVGVSFSETKKNIDEWKTELFS